MFDNTPFDMTGKTVLITGASGGLGGRFAETMAAAGAGLILAARKADNPRLIALQQQLGDKVDVRRLSLDVSSPESITDAIAYADEHAKGIDVLINNAGIADPASATEMDYAKWSRVLNTNLTGAWLTARQFALLRIEKKSPGVIVNITSVLGQRVLSGVLSYAVSKAGLEQMTKALALEWARHDIRVNSLAPGYIVTDMNRDYLQSEAAAPMIKAIPQRRVGEPKDLDGALLLLASDASAFMTGSTVVVDGGHMQASL